MQSDWAALQALENRLLLSAVAPAGIEFPVPESYQGDQSDASIAYQRDGSYVIAWTHTDSGGADVYARRFTAAGTPAGDALRVNITLTGDQSTPAVTADADGGWVIAWTSRGQDGSGEGVYARRYDAAGVALGDEIPVNTFTFGDQRLPAVAADASGNFVIAWQSLGQDGSGSGIYAQRFNWAGGKLGSEFRVNTATLKDQNTPAVGVDGAGNFSIVWQSVDQDGNGGGGIYAQRYDSQGAPIDGELRVNAFTTGNQSFPAIAVSPQGDAVIAWQSTGQDGSGDGIVARRFTASGFPRGDEFVVNATTAGHQRNPSVTIDPSTGASVIAWDSDPFDGSSSGVVARRFGVNGVAESGDVQVNIHTDNAQWRPSVSATPGGFVVAWQSVSQDGDAHGVYARAFDVFENQVAVGNRVWNDADADGLQDAGEAGRPNVTVRLFSAHGTLLATTTTDAGGSYAFDVLRPGDRYFIEFVRPGSTSFSVADAGPDDSVDSDAAPLTGRTAVFTASNEFDLTFDAGVVTPGAISGAKFYDFNGNGVREPTEPGLAGWKIFIDTDGDGALDPGERVADTDADGNYSITNLTVGTYTVTEVPQPGWQLTTPVPERTVTVRGGNAGTPTVNLGGTSATAPTFPTRPLGPATRVNAHVPLDQFDPAVAMDSVGNYAIVWTSTAQEGPTQNVYAQRFNRHGVATTPQFRVTSLGGPRNDAQAVLADDGRLIIVWSQQTGSRWDVYAQVYAPGGTTIVVPAFALNDPAQPDARTPDVALAADGQFVVTWTTYTPDESDVRARVFRVADGTPVGDELVVNSEITGFQRESTVAADDENGFVVTWLGYGPSGGGIGTFARRFTAAGVPAGGEFPVNTAAANGESDPSIAMAEDGNFVVAWAATSVRFQRFDRHGAKLGPETTILAGPGAAFQLLPVVAMEPGGRFLVTWFEGDGPGRVRRLAAQRFGADGSAVGPRFTVAESNVDGGFAPAVATNALGDVVVAWTTGDSDTRDVYARRYGDFVPSVVKGRLWDDADADGLADAGEPGRGGVVVEIFSASDGVIASTTTASDGTYQFGGIRAGGPYVVRFAPVPGRPFAPANVGSDDARDSDVDAAGRTAPFAVSQGTTLTFDAATRPGASVGGVVWHDDDRDGVRGAGEHGRAGVVVHLYRAGSLVASTSTDAAGAYRFLDLPADTDYVLQFVRPIAATFTQPDQSADDFRDSDANPQDGRTAPFALGAIQIDLSRSAGLIVPLAGSVGGFVWDDVNADGIRGPGESGRAGVTVRLLKGEVAVGTRVTDATGNYRFDGVPVGDGYSLQFDLLLGTLLTHRDRGRDDLLDSDPEFWSRRTAPFSVVSYQVDLSRSAGFAAPARIGGYVYDDSNGNGVQDGGERGIEGWTVYQDADFDGRFDAGEPTVISGQFGAYAFEALLPATYRVRAILPAGLPLTGPAATFTLGLGEQADADLGVRSTLASSPVVRDGIPMPVATSAKRPIYQSVAYDGAGNFVAVWGAFDANDDSYDIYARRYHADGTPASGETRVNANPASAQHDPSVDMDADGNYVVSWNEYGIADVPPKVLARRFAADGTPLSADVPVASATPIYSTSAIATGAGGSFVVAWTTPDNYDVYARRFNQQGTPLGDAFRINTLTQGDQTVPVMASDDAGNFVVAWMTSDGHDIRAQRFDAAGQRVGPEFTVNLDTEGEQRTPAISMNGNGTFVVAWKSASGTFNNDHRLYARRFDTQGNALGAVEVARFQHYMSGQPRVAIDGDGRFVVSYLLYDALSQPRLGLRQYTASSVPAGAEILIEPLVQTVPAGLAAHPDGGFTVVYDYLRAQRFVAFDDVASVGGVAWYDADSDGVRGAAEPVMSGTIVRLWTDFGHLYASTQTGADGSFRFDGVRPGVKYELEFVSSADLHFTLPDRGEDDTRDSDVNPVTRRTARFTPAPDGVDLTFGAGFAIPGSISGVKFNDLDGDGARDAREQGLPGWIIYLDDDGDGQRDAEERSATTDASGKFTFLNLTPGLYRVRELPQDRWSQVTAPAALDVQLLAGQKRTNVDVANRTMAANIFLSPAGDSFRVNTYTDRPQLAPAIAVDPLGNFIVAWTSEQQDGNGEGVYAQRYASDGTPIGAEFLVNTTTYGPQRYAAIDTDAAGKFVIVWEGWDQQTQRSHVYAQRFDANGDRIGQETVIDSTPDTLSHARPAVAMDADGDFVVAWITLARFGDPTYVRAQRVSAAGVHVGPVIEVGATSGSTHLSAAMDGDGDFVIGWNFGARLFRSDGTPAPMPNIPAGDETAVAMASSGEFIVARGSNGSIATQRYDAWGTPQGGAFLLNSPGVKSKPAVAMDASGESIVAWLASGGVRARRFNSAGLPQGSEIVIAAAADDTSSTPAVALSGAGVALFAWTGGYAGLRDVQARRYVADAAPAPSEIPDVVAPEDAPDATVNLHAAFHDPDGSDTALTYTVTGNTNPSLFASLTVGPDGTLALDFAPDAFGSATLTVTATDVGGAYASTAFNVTVQPVNDAPTLAPIADQTVAQNANAVTLALGGAGAGPGETQSLAFAVATDRPDFFADLRLEPPTIPGGMPHLHYTLAPNATGSASVTITVRDDGGTGFGGTDTFARTFAVTVSPLDTANPTADVVDVTPDPRFVPVETVTIRFSERVSGFDLGDLVVTRDGRRVPLPTATMLTSIDGGTTWTLDNLSSLTLPRGVYTVTVGTGEGITDLGGRPLLAAASDTFTVLSSAVAGADADDDWTVRSEDGQLLVYSAGKPLPIYAVPLTDIDRLSFGGGFGDDTLTIGGPIPVELFFDGGHGHDTLKLVGTDGSDNMTIERLAFAVGGHRGTFLGVDALRLDGGGGDDVMTVRGSDVWALLRRAATPQPTQPLPLPAIDAGPGIDLLRITGGTHAIDFDLAALAETVAVRDASVTLTRALDLPGLRIESGGHVSLPAGAGLVLRTGSLQMSKDARLHLADNELVVRDADPVKIAALIGGARNAGATGSWSGPGIGTSTSDALRGLAVLTDESEPSSVLVKYTYNGDADGDGRVNADDYFRIDSGFLAQPASPTYADGDFNYDDQVNADDYFLIDSSFLGQAATLSEASPTASTSLAGRSHASPAREKKQRRRFPTEVSLFSTSRISRRAPARIAAR